MPKKEITIDQMAQHPMGAVMLSAFRLCLKKNEDYATNADIFSNFRECEEMGITASQGVSTRLSDKWSRFKKGVRTQWNMSVSSEGMKDTMEDIINYACIYHCLYIEEEKKKKG
jgi:hypothetical protein